MKNHDLIGSALGFPGAWGPGWMGWGPAAGVTAFGVDEFAEPMDPATMAARYQRIADARAAAMARLGGGALGMPPGFCGYGVPAVYDPVLQGSLVAAQNSAVVTADNGPQATEQMIGQDQELTLEPGAIGTLTFTPELVAKLRRLFIPTKCASQLAVLEVKIGIKSQLVGSGAIPGLVFSEVSTNNRINGDTCYIRQPVIVRVKNVSGSTVEVESAVGVTAVQGAGAPRIIGGSATNT